MVVLLGDDNLISLEEEEEESQTRNGRGGTTSLQRHSYSEKNVLNV